MKHWLCIIITLSLLFSLAACTKTDQAAASSDAQSEAVSEEDSAPRSEEPSTEDSHEPRTENWMPTYKIETEELTLPRKLTDSTFFEMLDAAQNMVLLVEQEKITDQERMFSYYKTKRIILWDSVNCAELMSVIPQQEGWYCAGTIVDEANITCAVKCDYEQPFPTQYSLIAFGETEACILNLTGEIQSVRKWTDDLVIFSYYDGNDQFGVKSVSADGECSSILCFSTEFQQEPLGAIVSVCDDSFSYFYAEQGKGTFAVVDRDGKTERYTFDPNEERYDSSCLTSDGLLACLSYKKKSDATWHKLVLYNGEKRIEYPCGTLPLYGLCFAGNLGLAADNNWRFHVVAVAGEQLGEEILKNETLNALDTEAKQFIPADDVSFYVFFKFTENQPFYRVTIAPAA